jgi:hypothetical protein
MLVVKNEFKGKGLTVTIRRGLNHSTIDLDNADQAELKMIEAAGLPYVEQKKSTAEKENPKL